MSQPATIITICVRCGTEFGQPPHPATEEAFYYTCPKCRLEVYETNKKSAARDAAGIYHGTKK